MPERTSRRQRRNPYGELIHLLNERYHREWVRAELLQNELDGLRKSPAGRVVGWLQRLRARFWPRRPGIEPRITEHAVPYVADEEFSLPSGRVSLIIPFKDRPELLRNCLRSLRFSTYRDFEIVLVDNGSVDPRTLHLLDRLRQHRRFRVATCAEPFNFARLCNAGAARATGEHLLFLNNDTEVLTRDWIDQLLRISANPRVGVVGATLLYPDRTIQHAGLFPRSDGLWVHPHRGQPTSHGGEGGELRVPRMVPAVTAACLLIRRTLFDELGGFDERFPVAYNDVDLCLRVRQRGLAVVITPNAQLFHYEGLSRGFTVDVPGDRVQGSNPERVQKSVHLDESPTTDI